MKRVRLTLAALGVAGLMSGPALAAGGVRYGTPARAAAVAAHGHYGHVGRRARFGVRHQRGYYGYHHGGPTVRHYYGRQGYSAYRPYGYRSFYYGYGPRYYGGTHLGYPHGLGFYGYPGRGFSFSFGF